MTEPINLTDIRANPLDWLETASDDDLLALIDAVEAAAALRSELRMVGGGLRVEGKLQTLDAALARFSVPGRETP